MFGTIVNCIAVIAGAALGILFSKRVTSEISSVITSGAGVFTLIIGFTLAFQADNIIYLALSLIIGGIIGTVLDIDGKILAVGRFLERRFGSQRKNLAGEIKESRFAYAFLNASVLFSVGAMAIVGSFKAGTEGDYTLLYTKSVLDGFMSIVFAAAMGIGTAFAALTLLVYQGVLTLSSGFLRPFVSPFMIQEVTGIGGALILMIGINLLDLKKLKTANYLPAIVISIGFVLLDPVFSHIMALFV